jgi:hypothetical protein
LIETKSSQRAAGAVRRKFRNWVLSKTGKKKTENLYFANKKNYFESEKGRKEPKKFA